MNVSFYSRTHDIVNAFALATLLRVEACSVGLQYSGVQGHGTPWRSAWAS